MLFDMNDLLANIRNNSISSLDLYKERIAKAKDFQSIANLNGHTRWVNALAVLSDGRIVSGSMDDTLRIWDANTLHCIATLKGHTSAVAALAVLTDGRIVSGSEDNTLRLWDANTQQCIATLNGHTHYVYALAVLPDGRIVSGSWDHTLRLWDANTQQCIATLKGHTNDVRALAIMADGRIVSGSSDNTLRVWDADRQQCLAVLKEHSAAVLALAVLPDERIVSGSWDHTLRVWEGGVPVLSLADFDKLTTALKFNTSVKSLSFACSNLKLPQLQAIADLLRVNSSITSLDLSDNAITDAGAQLLIDALQVNKSLKVLNVSNNPISALFVKAIKDCLIQNQTRVYYKDDTMLFDVAESLTKIRNNSISSLDLYKERLAKAKDFQSTATLRGHASAVNALAVLPDGRIVSGSHDNTLRVWDADTQQSLASLKGHTNYVSALTVLTDGRIVSGSHDNTLRVWDADTQQCLATLTGHTRSVRALAIMGDGRIVSGSWDKTLRVWDADTQQCLATLKGHTNYVNALAIMGDGRIVSGSGDNTLRVWEGGVPVLSLADFDKLTTALKNNTSIKSVGFACSNLKLSQLQVIADLLKVNSTITSLDLFNNPITDAGARVLMNALNSNRSLRTLKLQGTSISFAVQQTLQSALQSNAATPIAQPMPAAPASFSQASPSLSPISPVIPPDKGQVALSESDNVKFGLDTASQLLTAIQTHNLTQLRELLDKGADADTTTHQQLTALHVAVLNANTEAVIALLEAGAATDKPTPEGKTALSLAAQQGHLAMVQRLLEEEAHIHHKDNEGYTPLMLAGMNGQLNVVECLLNQGANRSNKNNQGQTVLNLATKYKHKAVVEYLKAQRNISPQSHNSPNEPNKTASGESHSTPPKLEAIPASALTPPRQFEANQPVAADFKPQPSPITHESAIHLKFTIPSQELTLGKELGHGGFGIVYEGTWQYHTVAIKTLLARRLSDATLAEFKQEAEIMVSLQHPNVVRLFGITLDQTPYGMVMEYMQQGSLYSYLHSDKPLTWSTRIQIAEDTAKGLAFLHHKHILHRDLKSLNILLDKHLTAKLADFGLARLKKETSTTTATQQGVGTLRWMAPETFGFRPKYSDKSDIYAYGIVAWEIAARKLPYEEVSEESEIRNGVKSGDREELPAGCPAPFSQIIEQCWQQEAEQRPTAGSVVHMLSQLKSADDAVNSASSSQPASGYPGVAGSTINQSSANSYKNNMNSGPV